MIWQIIPVVALIVMRFEYGFSTTVKDTLVIWEAPEGDKTSKAQVIIDNMIAGGYPKYNLRSSIVFLLPHYNKCEDASKVCSGRPERFLQLVNNCETEMESDVNKQMQETNMILANVSTPANFFHLLRRQMYLRYKRPLMIFTPNLMVSHPECKSKIADLGEGTKFQSYFPDETIKDPLAVKKVILCSGKIYYDLRTQRREKNLEDVIAICRIEQICPLPYKIIIEDLKRYPKAKFCWCQEEPINQGYWSYIEPRLLNLPDILEVTCAGRSPRADLGSRSTSSCNEEELQLYQDALHIPPHQEIIKK